MRGAFFASVSLRGDDFLPSPAERRENGDQPGKDELLAQVPGLPRRQEGVLGVRVRANLGAQDGAKRKGEKRFHKAAAQGAGSGNAWVAQTQMKAKLWEDNRRKLEQVCCASR